MSRNLKIIKGGYVYTEESKSDYCYLLSSGSISLKSSEFEDCVLLPGDVFGLYYMLSNNRHREYAVALEDSEMVELTKGEIREIILKNTVIREKIISKFLTLLKKVNSRVEKNESPLLKEIPEKIFNGFLYYYTLGHVEKTKELFERLQNYKNSSYFVKALECLYDNDIIGIFPTPPIEGT